jgi:hypothetical protein
MRYGGIILAIFLAASVNSWAKKEETLEQLKTRAESSSNLEERANLSVEIAERQLHNADQFYTQGSSEQARAAVEDIVAYSEKARDAATKSGKKLKPTEIAMRKMAHKLRDIKRTLNFEDQGPVQAAIDRLESIRTDLLAKMFGKGEK